MKYKVKMFCNDCTGEDFMGCGDGYPWFLDDDHGDPILFDTKEQATAAGDKESDDCGPWDYEIVTVKGVKTECQT